MERNPQISSPNRSYNAFDCIKVFTILLVILGHITRYSPNSSFPHEENRIISLITYAIYSFHMPLFIFVSGCIYGLGRKKGKYEKTSDFMINKFKRLIIPYLSFGVLVLAPCLIFTQLTSKSYINYLLSDLLIGGDIKHLWFLLSLFEMFIIAHILKPILITKPFYVFAASIFFPIIIDVHSWGGQFNMTFKFLPYFLLGYYIIFKDKWKTKLNWTTTTLLCILILGAMFIQIKYPSIGYKYGIMDNIIAFPIIFIIYNITSQKIRLNANRQYYQILLKDNFGIYLFHPMIIYVLYYLHVFDSLNYYIQIILIFCITSFISIVITSCIKKTRLKFIIGE